jgi:hypothetical protein
MIEAVEERVAPASYPVAVHVRPHIEDRNRLTAAFRFFLALPHILLVGAPIASVASISWSSDGTGWEIGSGGGLLSVVVVFAALVAWLAIVFTGHHPDSLRRLSAWYLRWRVRAIAYLTLLRDEYPPFGDGEYPLELAVPEPSSPRDRVSVAFRLLLALPHLVVLSFLGVAWSFTTALAWVVILFTGRYPESLYGFALGVLAWTTRVEAYLLLLRDEYPPFTLRT